MFLCSHVALCEDGDIRLVNGFIEYEGHLEVCFDQKWGTVNGNGWSDNDTRVVCRQLGYQTTGTPLLLDTYSAVCVYRPKQLWWVKNCICTIEVCMLHNAGAFYYWVGHRRRIISSPIFMNNVGCYGQESKLTDCSFGTDTAANHHSDDVVVYCYFERDGKYSYHTLMQVVFNYSYDYAATVSFTDFPSATPSHTDASDNNAPIYSAALGMAALSLAVAALSLAAVGAFIVFHCVKRNSKSSDK